MKRSAVGIVIALVVLSTSAAYAHYVYDEWDVWQSAPGNPGWCLRGRSETSHGNSNHGYLRAEGKALRPADYAPGNVQADCELSWYMPPGSLKLVSTTFWRWVETHEVWGVCGNWIDRVNTSQNWFVRFENYTNNNCGDGWYGTTTKPRIKVDDVWQGETDGVGVWSGYHWLEG